MTLPDVRVRCAAANDIGGIREIEAIPTYRTWIGNWSEQEYARTLLDGSAVVKVADAGGGVAGFYVLRNLAGKDRSVELMRIAVKEPGCGVGGMLLRDALGTAFDGHGAHRVWLDVFTNNPRARRVYAKAGFVHEGTLRDSKCRDGCFQSQHLMSMLEDEYRARYGLHRYHESVR